MSISRTDTLPEDTSVRVATHAPRFQRCAYSRTVEATGAAFPVMMDGGFRRGTDVLKAIAHGARMVFVGRPFNFAAAVCGEAGILHAIDLLRAEVDRDIAMLGVGNCTELGRQFLIRKHWFSTTHRR